MYLTTDPSSIPLQQLNDLFGQPDFHWGKPLPEPQLEAMLRTSLCFAMFASSNENEDNKASPRLVGLGRFITDDVTVVYINDIYIAEAYRGKGLAKWMLSCMNEQLALMPDLRGTILIVEKGTPTETLYKRHFAMEDLVATDVLLDRKGPGSTS